MTRLAGVLPIVWLLQSTLAAAQVFELAAVPGVACASSEATLCGGGNGLGMLGGRADILVSDRVSVGAYAGFVSLPRATFDIAVPPGPSPTGTVTVSRRDFNRLFTIGEVRYLFRTGARLRPLVGFGLGAYREAVRTTCEPAGCERLPASWLGNEVIGNTSAMKVDVAVTAALRGDVGRNWIVTGGVQFHNPSSEHAATTQVFFDIGHRWTLR